LGRSHPTANRPAERRCARHRRTGRPRRRKSRRAAADECAARQGYAIDKQTGQLTPLNRQSCGGKNPVHLAVDPTNRFIVTANYGAGSVGVVPIEKDGTLGARTDLAMLPGEPGPNRKEQASSHPHDCPFDPAGRFILVPDKGLDRVFSFKLDSASGKLTPNDPPFTATREGAGPRHIAFHPSLPYAYVIGELDSTMTTYRYDPARGAVQPVHVIPTVPPSFTAKNTGRRSPWPRRGVLSTARIAGTTASSPLPSTAPGAP
jgi:6-phosphogluconolactonase (cycloisomerase 2 family)